MGKYDGEKIKKLILDGWSFREKTVSGKRYITRRKGQKERGMGPFSDELWSIISESQKEGNIRVSTESSDSNHVNQNSDNESFLDSLAHTHKLLESGVLKDRGVSMWTNCVYKDEEGYCKFWNWDKQPDFFRYSDELSLGNYTRKKVYFNGVESSRWVYFASPWYCQSCPTFESDLTILNSAVVASRAHLPEPSTEYRDKPKTEKALPLGERVSKELQQKLIGISFLTARNEYADMPLTEKRGRPETLHAARTNGTRR